MLKKKITFTDFNDEEVEETHYFNLSKSELVEMEVSYGNVGFEQHMQRIIEANDRKALVKEFKELILMAYGEKSEDGKRFIKNDEIREAFSQTAAYQELFLELATKDDVAVEFIVGILPKDMHEEAQALVKAMPKTTAQIAAEQAKDAPNE
jgi:hypothetical protein